MKIQLIHPPADSQYESVEVISLRSLPVGLYLLKNGIKLWGKNIDVEILDGNILRMEKIISMINSDIVGVSSWHSKHRNAVKITEVAKAKNPNCMTILGGPNATFLGEIILQKRPSIDFVFTGNSEYDLVKIINVSNGRSDDLEGIANLWFRDKSGNPIFTFNENSPMNIFVDPDFVEPLYKKNPFPISFIRGCIKAVRKGRCSFCSLGYRGLDTMNPELVWKQIRILWEKHGIDYFFETGDSFIPGYYKRIIKSRPTNLNHIKFRIYASPDQINRETVNLLKNMNVQEVFLGLETNNDLVLKKAGKDYHFKDEIKALELLTAADIAIQAPFIYGLPGSTPLTEKENYLFAKYVVDNFNINSLLASAPIPVVGSELYRMVTGGKIESDIINYEQLTQQLISRFSECSFDQIMNFVRKTCLLMEKTGNFGFTK